MTVDAFGGLLRSMLGPPEPQPGPPFTHTLRPLEPVVIGQDEDGDDVLFVPWSPTFTVGHRTRGRLHELAPIEPSAAFRRLSAEMPTSTVGIGCYRPLTDEG